MRGGPHSLSSQLFVLVKGVSIALDPEGILLSMWDPHPVSSNGIRTHKNHDWRSAKERRHWAGKANWMLSKAYSHSSVCSVHIGKTGDRWQTSMALEEKRELNLQTLQSFENSTVIERCFYNRFQMWLRSSVCWMLVSWDLAQAKNNNLCSYLLNKERYFFWSVHGGLGRDSRLKQISSHHPGCTGKQAKAAKRRCREVASSRDAETSDSLWL